jgi:hypothetical protein
MQDQLLQVGSLPGKKEEEGPFYLQVPEWLVRQVYILYANISQPVGYETGRPSSAFLQEANFESLRNGAKKFLDAETNRKETGPYAVLYQLDEANPLNPITLVMSYRNFVSPPVRTDPNSVTVKPVVSDFDLLLMGTDGASSKDPLITKKFEIQPLDNDQINVAAWEVDATAKILEDAERDVSRGSNPMSWGEAWTPVYQKDHAMFHYPSKFGFGDTATLNTVAELVEKFATSTGAIRHGAESFNLTFPQDLDEELLVIEAGQPVKYMSEEKLREYLLKKATEENYVFPLNPAWILRDFGWEVLYQAEKPKFLRWWGPKLVKKIDDFLESPCYKQRRERFLLLDSGATIGSPILSGQHEESTHSGKSGEDVLIYGLLGSFLFLAGFFAALSQCRRRVGSHSTVNTAGKLSPETTQQRRSSSAASTISTLDWSDDFSSTSNDWTTSDDDSSDISESDEEQSGRAVCP